MERKGRLERKPDTGRWRKAGDAIEFVTLPKRVLLTILGYLEPRDLCRLQATCKQFRTLAGKNVLWLPLLFRDYAWWINETWRMRAEHLHGVKWQREYKKLVQVFKLKHYAKVNARHQLDYCLKLDNLEERRKYCHRCWRPLVGCLCSHLPTVPYNNCHCRVIVIQHPKCQVADGTLRLLVLGLKYCKVVITTDVTSPNVPEAGGVAAEIYDLLKHKTHKTYFLYPGDHHVPRSDVTDMEPLCAEARPDISGLTLAEVMKPPIIPGLTVPADAVIPPPEEPSPAQPRSSPKASGGEENKSHTHSEAHDGCACPHNPTDTKDASNGGAGPSDEKCECGCPKDHDYSVLIAVDGSWQHAKLIVRMNPALMTQVTSQVEINHHPPSIYGLLKREPTEQCISTVESVSYAVGVLQEGEATRVHRDVIPALRRIIEIQRSHKGGYFTNTKKQKKNKQQQQQQSGEAKLSGETPTQHEGSEDESESSSSSSDEDGGE